MGINNFWPSVEVEALKGDGLATFVKSHPRVVVDVSIWLYQACRVNPASIFALASGGDSTDVDDIVIGKVRSLRKVGFTDVVLLFDGAVPEEKVGESAARRNVRDSNCSRFVKGLPELDLSTARNAPRFNRHLVDRLKTQTITYA